MAHTAGRDASVANATVDLWNWVAAHSSTFNINRAKVFDQLSPSLRRFGEDRIRRAAVSVAVALPGELRRELRAIRVVSYDSITLELSGNRTVHWGSAEQSEAKVAALRAVMNAAEDARYFDVSAPSAPASAAG